MSGPVPGDAAHRGDGGSYTVIELGRLVGMSPRNIRAHQARRILPPPTRRGRIAYYDDAHVHRLEAIKALQRRGFNLASIEAMLGLRAVEVTDDSMRDVLTALAAEQPGLLYTLTRHGVLVRADDGTVRVARGRALRAAHDLRRVGVAPVQAMRLLAEVLDDVRLFTRELVEHATARVLGLNPALAPATDPWDPDTMTLAQSLLGLLVEALRVSVDNNGDTVMSDLFAHRPGVHTALRAATDTA